MRIETSSKVVDFDGQWVTFDWKNFEDTPAAVVPVESVAGVDVKDAGRLSKGRMVLDVIMPDGSHSKDIEAGTPNPYSMVFNRKLQSQVDEFVNAIRPVIPVQPARLPEAAKAVSPKMPTWDSSIDKFKGDDGTTIKLHKQTIRNGWDSKPLDGVTARVESGSEMESRFTATRIALLGVFALAFKKKKGGEKYLTIDGPDFSWIAEVNRKHVKDAMKFAAKVNNSVREAAAETLHSAQAGTLIAPGEGEDIASAIAKLSDMYSSGMLSDEEFATAKKKTLGL